MSGEFIVVNDEQLLTTKQVAEILNLSIPTIYKYIKEKRLHPIYEDSWQIDETHLFKKEDVEELKGKLEKPGLTTGEVAKQLQVHPTTVAAYIKKGELKATKQLYKGRNLYFIKEEEVVNFKRSHPKQQKRRKKDFYHKATGLYLFQTVKNKQTFELGRIMKLSNGSGEVWTESGEIIVFDQMQQHNFFAVENFLEKSYITKRGYVIFRFPIPKHIASPIFPLIELFYRALSYRNIRVTKREQHIQLEVKPCFIKELNEDSHPYEINLLQKHIIKGSVIKRHNGLLLESDMEVLTINLSSSLKNRLKELAKHQDLTMEEYVRKLIQMKASEHQ